ncbi:hypothetical protein ACFLV5_03515, partial [Chloroflexota bacterium]
MTGWEIPQSVARVIVFLCLGLMTVGVALILVSFRRTKVAYREDLAITGEMLKVYGGQLQPLDKVATNEIKRERTEKL